MGKYNRSIDELEKNAIKWWPEHLKKLVAKESIIPMLSETHDTFVSILKSSNADPNSVFKKIQESNISYNLFLKHLVIFSDFGGEQISRLGKEFKNLFPSKKDHFYIEFKIGNKNQTYSFQKLPIKGLGNSKLLIDKDTFLKTPSAEEKKIIEDMITILLFGAFSVDLDTAEVLDKCDSGQHLGKATEVDEKLKKLYLSVSRITGGSTANDSGQILERHVEKYLKEKLGKSFVIKKDKILCEGKNIPFDIVAAKNEKKVGIEISFQVTTNSTIERKAAQASQRRNIMNQSGHKVAFIIDGAGNFQRKSAIGEICKHSDCTVAFSDAELDLLALFIQEHLK